MNPRSPLSQAELAHRWLFLGRVQIPFSFPQSAPSRTQFIQWNKHWKVNWHLSLISHDIFQNTRLSQSKGLDTTLMNLSSAAPNQESPGLCPRGL